MKRILNCLAEDYFWLFEDHGFRITDSVYDKCLGGQGMILLSNQKLAIKFITDRDHLYLEFFPVNHCWPVDEFVTVDLLYTKITGKYIDSAMVNDSTTDFIRNNFESIKSVMNTDLKNLLAELRKLKKERAKRLWG